MSEEEIVLKRLKDTLAVLTGKNVITNLDLQIRNMVEDCIKVIEKQQEELEELRKYYATRKEVEELKDTINCLHESAKEYINKQVIKDKIEEFKNIGIILKRKRY